MSDEHAKNTLSAGWEQHDKPASLSRRLAFPSYAETRRFLDRLAALSEREGYYPSSSFGTTYVNVTIDARDGKAISPADIAFASEIDSFCQKPDAA
ncbi:MAG: 4a-hydroxytetrahydrobiopterin dehydratase [Mariprofundaceae bacterium]|nr:4a-hydroxytetrahydrobiopterin dehydratase [Mariprofundaceae bacterium]